MFDKIALNQGTIKHLPLDQALFIAQRSGYSGFGVWSERVTAYMEAGHDLEETYQLIRHSGLKIVELIFLKEWLFVTGKEKEQSMREIENICQMAQAINAECITAPAYGFEGDIQVGIQNFKDFCDIAKKYNIKVAIEFVPTFKIDSLFKAWEIVRLANRDNGGIVVDTFHVFKGTTKLDDFNKIPIDRIFLVHMCDIPYIDEHYTDLVTQARNHRVFPGEGHFDLHSFLNVLNYKKYTGSFSLEILNQEFKNMDALKIAETGKASLETLLSENYKKIAAQIRSVMLEKSFAGGVHFSSSLGVVELSVALNAVFDFTKDHMIFDIGHQRFPHLILQEQQRTGKLQYPTKENYNMYSYPGFVGLSVASALGHTITYPNDKTIALIGDGSLTCGEVFESLNNLGQLGGNVLVILNQNDQSIGSNVGALSHGTTLQKFAESLNFEYLGIVDGHDITSLIKALNNIKDKKYPMFLHIKTVKGKGYKPAENNPTKFHRPISPFDKETGEFQSNGEEAQKVLAKSINILEEKGIEYIEKYDNVYFTSPACPLFAKLTKAYPSHVIDTGINEQHCLTLSTTLADLGNKVVMSLIAPFLTRCYSQCYDLCHQGAPLTIVMTMSGVNTLGATHQAVYAHGLLRQIPNATVMYAANLIEYKNMLDFAVSYNKPIFLLVPKENIEIIKPEFSAPIEYARGVVEKEGSSLTLLSIGSTFGLADSLAKKYDGIEIINPRFLKPFDYKLLNKSVAKTKRLLILEDGFKNGGLGEEIMTNLVKANINCKCKIVAADNIFPIGENKLDAEKEYGITKEKCEEALQELLNCNLI